MIKIYGPKLSTAWRCLWTAEEAGVAWESTPVDMKGDEHKTEHFLKMNPNGKVPVMVDGDFILWESTAINVYIAEKYKPELLGSSIEEHALVNQWTSWVLAHLAHPVEVLALQVWRKTPDDHHTAHARETLPRFLSVLERHMAHKTWVVAEKFTLADIAIISVIRNLSYFGLVMDEYPNISAYIARTAERPAYQVVSAQ